MFRFTNPFRAGRVLSNRQFIKPSGMSNGDLIKKNAILLRRTLRGSPGNWIVDSTVIMNRDQPFTAENHVIVVELEESNTHEELDSFRRILILSRFLHTFYQ